MLLGSLQIKLRIPEANSLKAKRAVIKSIVARIRSKFNVSVSEVDDHDLWQSAFLGVVMVGNERKHMDGVLSKVLDLVRAEPRLELLDMQLDFF